LRRKTIVLSNVEFGTYLFLTASKTHSLLVNLYNS